MSEIASLMWSERQQQISEGFQLSHSMEMLSQNLRRIAFSYRRHMLSGLEALTLFVGRFELLDLPAASTTFVRRLSLDSATEGSQGGLRTKPRSPRHVPIHYTDTPC